MNADYRECIARRSPIAVRCRGPARGVWLGHRPVRRRRADEDRDIDAAGALLVIVWWQRGGLAWRRDVVPLTLIGTEACRYAPENTAAPRFINSDCRLDEQANCLTFTR